MYKSKLLELCQQRKWTVPEYVVVKEGQDHNPRFQATVVVDGQSFQSQSLTRSSKEAQNDVAKLAFDHFSLPSPKIPSPLCPPPPPGEAHYPGVDHCPPPTPAPAASTDFNDVHQYKVQLQNYAQKRSFALPLYSCKREGPPHASRFKCMVTVGGQTYSCGEYFPTISKAEQAAARVALMSLLPSGIEEDLSACKNLLQELAQKEGFHLPIYSTERTGESHMPTFISTVEVEGEVFTGQGAKTKKLAEMSAAKAAYTALKQRTSGQSSAAIAPTHQGQEDPSALEGQEALAAALQGQEARKASSSSMQSALIEYLQKYVQPKLPVSNEEAEEDIVSTGSCPTLVSGKVVSHHLNATPGSEISSLVNGASDAPSSSMPVLELSSTLPADSSSDAAPALNLLQVVGKNRFPGRTRIVVHPRSTKMTYPEGATVLPMSDDNYVAVEMPETELKIC